MTTPFENARRYRMQSQVLKRLLEKYTHISKEDDVIVWLDQEHREAYYFLCSHFGIKRRA